VHAFERHVPAALQLASDQAIGRIDGVIFARGSLLARWKEPKGVKDLKEQSMP
jgi:hypothetical protein